MSGKQLIKINMHSLCNCHKKNCVLLPKKSYTFEQTSNNSSFMTISKVFDLGINQRNLMFDYLGKYAARM